MNITALPNISIYIYFYDAVWARGARMRAAGSSEDPGPAARRRGTLGRGGRASPRGPGMVLISSSLSSSSSSSRGGAGLTLRAGENVHHLPARDHERMRARELVQSRIKPAIIRPRRERAHHRPARSSPPRAPSLLSPPVAAERMAAAMTAMIGKGGKTRRSAAG